VFIGTVVHVPFGRPPPPSPAKEFGRCANDLLDDFCHVKHDIYLSHYETLILIYLLFEISDRNKSNRL
jgi:hypothetical protein